MTTLLQLAQVFALVGIGYASLAIGLYYLVHTPGTVSDTHHEPDQIS